MSAVSNSLVALYLAPSLYLLCLKDPTAHSSLRPLAFQSIGELFVGSLLLYQGRLFERQRGSAKYAASTLVILAIDGLAHLILSSSTSYGYYLGPSSILAANLVSYWTEVPAIDEYKILGVRLTDKVWLYASCAYYFALAARRSPLSFATGAILQTAYYFNVFRFRSLKVPRAICKACSMTLGRIWGRPTGQARIWPPASAGRQAQVDQTQRSAQIQVSEEALLQLLAMGFDEEQSRRALLQSDNNVHSAIAKLL